MNQEGRKRKRVTDLTKRKKRRKDKNFTKVPNGLIYHLSDFGLNKLDFYIIINVKSYQYEEDSNSFPSLERIGRQMGCSSKTIQRQSDKMKALGYLNRGTGRRANWDFSPLFEMLKFYNTPAWSTILVTVKEQVNLYGIKTTNSTFHKINKDILRKKYGQKKRQMGTIMSNEEDRKKIEKDKKKIDKRKSNSISLSDKRQNDTFDGKGNSSDAKTPLSPKVLEPFLRKVQQLAQKQTM